MAIVGAILMMFGHLETCGNITHTGGKCLPDSKTTRPVKAKKQC